MAASKLSSIIFFLLFIIFSLIDEKAFAAHMGHRKLIGSKEIMTMRRNLQGTGAAKINTPGSNSQRAGSKFTQNEPSKTHPDQAKPQEKINYVSYKALQRHEVCNGTNSSRCTRTSAPPTQCTYFRNCKRAVAP